jgi:hypothetical protein
MKANSSKPYMRDFSFYRQKFQLKHREIKEMMQKFGNIADLMLEDAQASRKPTSGDLEAPQKQSNFISMYNQYSDAIQL